MLNNRVILRQAVEQMYAQLPNWSEACANYAALDQVWTRQLSPEPNEGQRETHAIAQAANWENLSIMFNPGRVRSTTAKVEKGVPTSRPCFLCCSCCIESLVNILNGAIRLAADHFFGRWV